MRPLRASARVARPGRRIQLVDAALEDDGRTLARATAQLVRTAAVPGTETDEWIQTNDVDGQYVNRLTVRSFDLLRTYEPQAFIADIAPTPLMMIVADNDTQTPTAWQLEAMREAGEPHELVRIDCRHYDVYMKELPAAATAATRWFVQHLQT